MNKRQLALKILLPTMIVLIITLILTQVLSFDFTTLFAGLEEGASSSQGSGAEALGAAFGALGAAFGLAIVVAIILAIGFIIPSIGMAVFAFVDFILSILLLALNKKTPVIITALVFLFLVLPFIAGATIFSIGFVGQMLILAPILAVTLLLVNVASIVVCCVDLHITRINHKKAVFAQAEDGPAEIVAE